VAGLLANKDAAAFFQAFAPLGPRVVATPFEAASARPPADLAAAAAQAGLSAAVAPS
jgi:dihydrofolate synthase/folylpolyglutamate synthase